MRTPICLLAFALLVPLGCTEGALAAHTASPAAAADGGPPALPPGCDAQLSGEWQHDNDADLEDSTTYWYSAVDDGTRVTLRPYRTQDDGGAAPTPEGMRIELRRSPSGFAGQFEMIEDVGGGKKCPASFGARVIACGKDRLTLRIEQSYTVDQNCKRSDVGGPDFADHVLVRRRTTAAR